MRRYFWHFLIFSQTSTTLAASPLASREEKDCPFNQEGSARFRDKDYKIMSNAEKFTEIAGSEFLEGALPDHQVYEHPLVKR